MRIVIKKLSNILKFDIQFDLSFIDLGNIKI